MVLTFDIQIDRVGKSCSLGVGGHAVIIPARVSLETLQYETLIPHNHTSTKVLSEIHSLKKKMKNSSFFLQEFHPFDVVRCKTEHTFFFKVATVLS